MKLNAIDDMINLRAEFYKRNGQHKNVLKGPPDKIYFNGSNIEDRDILVKVRDIVLPLIETKLNEAKTKLMMVGITEFPE